MKKAYFACMVAAGLLLGAGGASAAITTFYGADDGATQASLKPNSFAALNSFNAMVGGPSFGITFEGLAHATNPNNVTVATGVTLTVTGNVAGGIVNSTPAVEPLGFSIGGTQWLQMVPDTRSSATAVFTFADPITSFGMFVTDSEAGFPGNITVDFNDGTAHSLGFAKTANGGGVLFFGFVDVGHSFSSVTISTGTTTLSRDVWGVDNVQFARYVAAPVPEPETYAMMLAGLGLLGFSARRRKQQAA